MPQVGAPPKNKKYLNWSKQRRFAEGARLVVFEGHTQTEAALEVGVSRPRLSEHVHKLRAEHEQKLAKAKAEQLGSDLSRAAAGPLGLQEQRRVGTFWEFSNRYWGGWSCPDCGIHHADPNFHREAIEAVEGDDKRIVINMAPFHAKSTLITVKNTIYKITKNPNHRRIIISKSLPFAKTFLISINDLLTNREIYGDGPNLIDDWGPFKNDDSIWSSDRIYVAGRQSFEKDPTVLVLGMGQQIYGRRADDIVSDDVATVINQKNPQLVADQLSWYDKEVSSRVGKNGKLIWVGTRVQPGDIYSHLRRRNGYRVLTYPCILDDVTEQVLWPEHFPYDAAIIKREEMSIRDWQLVYQNIDAPGEGASFTEEMLDDCKDTLRVSTQFEPGWVLIGGVDLAGGTKDSGYTAGVLVAVDLNSGKRFLVDSFNQKGMRSPVLKDKLLEWCAQYPVYELRVENNGLQGQLVQYDNELIKKLALQGTRVVGHHTQNNKWDPQFGVESLAPVFTAGLYSIPWANIQAQRMWTQLIEQLLLFPMGQTSDLVMALWFADLGIRDKLRRAHLPMFDEKATKKWPNRVKRNRKIIDFSTQTVRSISAEDQRGPVMATVGTTNYRRLITGRPTPRDEMKDPEPFVDPYQKDMDFQNVAPAAGE